MTSGVDWGKMADGKGAEKIWDLWKMDERWKDAECGVDGGIPFPKTLEARSGKMYGQAGFCAGRRNGWLHWRMDLDGENADLEAGGPEQARDGRWVVGGLGDQNNKKNSRNQEGIPAVDDEMTN